MKCANIKVSGLKISAIVGVLTLAVLGFFPLSASAQAPVVAAPSVPTPPNVKEVSPVTVPSAAPLASAGMMAADEDDDSDLVPGAMNESAVPGAAIGTRADQIGRIGGMPQTPGAGAPPPNSNIPSAVTDVVGDLRRAEKNVTLEDVARAQDALARLDLLLNIEKKINEIERTRDERKNIGKSLSRDGGSGLNQIPAGALNLPLTGNTGGMTAPFRAATAPPAARPVAATPAPAPKATTDGYKVEQINGSNGHYRAVISDSGKKNTVSTGDKIGAFTVTNISATGVTLTSGKDRKVLSVESGGVPMVVRSR